MRKLYYRITYNHKGQPCHDAIPGTSKRDAFARWKAQYPGMIEWHQTARMGKPITP